jgi:hypothetical protein
MVAHVADNLAFLVEEQVAVLLQELHLLEHLEES